MRALIRLLATRSGQLLVATAVGSDAGLTASTVYRYLSLLEEVFLVKRIPAWSRNVSTRAVGTPKLAFTDSGIAANLLGADVRSLLRPGGRFGPLLEGFVLMELARQLTWSRQRAELFHYRTVSLDMRHRGQINEVEVMLPEKRLKSALAEGLRTRFYARYEQLYGRGSSYGEARLEIVTLRLRATAATPHPKLSRGEADQHEDPTPHAA